MARSFLGRAFFVARHGLGAFRLHDVPHLRGASVQRRQCPDRTDHDERRARGRRTLPPGTALESSPTDVPHAQPHPRPPRAGSVAASCGHRRSAPSKATTPVRHKRCQPPAEQTTRSGRSSSVASEREEFPDSTNRGLRLVVIDTSAFLVVVACCSPGDQLTGASERRRTSGFRVLSAR
jgi:hypothetical protein